MIHDTGFVAGLGQRESAYVFPRSRLAFGKSLGCYVETTDLNRYEEFEESSQTLDRQLRRKLEDR